MILVLQIDKTAKASISLEERGKLIDQLRWQDKQNLSEKLLPKINILLKRNNITVQELEDVNLAVDMEESYSAYRIASATMKTLRYCMGKEL
ncbi:MAG: hypothetical protein U9Q72_00975 [Patescibacteria group bacterium]|nr:hypothetical protein [Patescibacteria group bacterium]